MQHTAVVAGLMSADLRFLLQNRDARRGEFFRELESGRQPHDAAADDQDALRAHRFALCPGGRTLTSSPPGKKFLACQSNIPQHGRARMKAKIIITPKKAVLDPQGKTVQHALEHMGYRGVTAVHVGKYIEIDLTPGSDKNAAQQALNDAAHKFLSNPIIEDYRLEIAE